MRQKERTQFDETLKNLFSHPQMIHDLLKAFLDPVFFLQIDLKSLQIVNGSFITTKSKLKRRDSDSSLAGELITTS